MNDKCLICNDSKSVIIKKWNDYIIHKCEHCGLNFCPYLIDIEGESSPVHKIGMEMMEKSFYRTKKIAKTYAERRILIYNNYLKRKCENILDIGCGPGVFYEPYKNLSINWKGIEVSKHWIDFGKKNNIPIEKIDIGKIKKSFDVITAHQVLEHVENPNKFLSKIIKILKPGGILHFELPNQSSLTSQLRKLSPMISYDYGFIQPPMHMRAYTKKTIKYLFDKNNLLTKSIITCSNNDITWGQVRDYSIAKVFFYSMTGLIGKGSLLIGIAKKDDV